MDTFFHFWVELLWGSSWLALIGTALLYSIIAILGRMSWFAICVLLALYFVVFGTAFFGIIVYLPLFLFGVVYFFLQLNKLLNKE